MGHGNAVKGKNGSARERGSSVPLFLSQGEEVRDHDTPARCQFNVQRFVMNQSFGIYLDQYCSNSISGSYTISFRCSIKRIREEANGSLVIPGSVRQRVQIVLIRTAKGIEERDLMMPCRISLEAST